MGGKTTLDNVSMSFGKRLELTMRKRMPMAARRALRLGRHLFSKGQKSLALPPHLVEDCRVCADRFDLVDRLPKGGRIAEVGTDRGDFAHHILDTARPAELHVIDLDISAVDPALLADPRVTMYNGLSHEVLSRFPDAHFDWIYIDADHSYAGVVRDAAAAAGKVKPGGYLVFNDFAHMDPFLGSYGVHRAAVEFAVERNWPMAWLAYETSALYDVAFRRPLTK